MLVQCSRSTKESDYTFEVHPDRDWAARIRVRLGRGTFIAVSPDEAQRLGSVLIEAAQTAGGEVD